MKHLIFPLFFSITSHLFSFGQGYKKAVVTDVVFVRQTNTAVNSLSFPFYFHHKDFMSDVQSDIKKYLGLKFGVDSVEFSLPDSISYYSGYFPKKLNTKEKAKVLGGGDKKILFVSIETKIQQWVEISGVNTYRFITEINIYNGKGKLFYRFKNIIPFETYSGEEVSGNAQMSDFDFYVFYFDGIKSVFEGQVKADEKRYVSRPLTEKYNDFAAYSEKFYMTFANTTYNYGSDIEKLAQVLNLNNNNLVAGAGYFNFGLVFESNMITDGIFLENKFLDKKYKVQLASGSKYVYTYANPATALKFYSVNQSTDTATMYVYDRNGTLTAGSNDSTQYKLMYNSGLNCLEFLHNDILFAVINELDDKKVILVSNYVSESQLGEMFNMLFVYEYAMAIENKLYYYYSSSSMYQ